MATLKFSKKELSFLEELPKHIDIECPKCLKVMLNDPHQVTCCGQNYCRPCIETLQCFESSCPMCKESTYQAFIDKKTLRIINGLQVYCTNTKEGCEWKGELKNLSTHLSKDGREGECEFEKVKCRYNKCEERKQRRYLDDHEKNDCLQRPYQCQYCTVKKTYTFIIKEHYEDCPQYPALYCPNKCDSESLFSRPSLNSHLSEECPLQPVECMFSWAGCTDTPLRKDSQSHTTDLKHMSLLAVTCGQLKSENEKLKGQMEAVCQALTDNIQILPVTLAKRSYPVHLYTHKFGYYISLLNDGSVKLAIHEGPFDKFKPKLPKISIKANGEIVPLLTDTEADYKRLDHDILKKSNGSTYTEGRWINAPLPPELEVFAVWN